jgi:hypothetical protein
MANIFEKCNGFALLSASLRNSVTNVSVFPDPADERYTVNKLLTASR